MLKKLWQWVVVFIGTIGSIAGLVAISIFNKHRRDEIVDDYVDSTNGVIEKINIEEKKSDEKMDNIANDLNDLANGKRKRSKRNTKRGA